MNIMGGYETSNSWDLVTEIVKRLNDDTITVISKEWQDSFKKKFDTPLDLKDMGTWSTFAELVSFRFRASEEGSVLCHVEVKERWGYSERVHPRFTADFEMPLDFLQLISTKMSNVFKSHLGAEQEEFLQRQRIEWMQKRGRELLGNDELEIEEWW